MTWASPLFARCAGWVINLSSDRVLGFRSQAGRWLLQRGAPIVLVQTVIFLGFVAFGFEALYGLQYELFEGRLEGIASRAESQFKDVAAERWQEQGQDLAEAMDLSVDIFPLDEDELPEDVYATVDALPVLQAAVVTDYDLVYLRLPDNWVVELEPGVISFGVNYLVELCLFLALLLGTLAALLACDVAMKRSLERRFDQRLTDQRDLLHGVAHELRSPMARLNFALEMLPELGDSESASLKASMHKSLKDLDGMVAELLQYARLQGAPVLSVASPLSLKEVVDTALEAVSDIYPQIRFQSDLPETFTCSGDFALLVRVFTNVLRNAGRYAKGHCAIHGQQQGEHVILYVDDDGDGIPPGKRERIFEPFTRLDPSRSRDSGGVGLGLAIVQSILRMHRGTVSADESPSGGARFVIVLPTA